MDSISPEDQDLLDWVGMNLIGDPWLSVAETLIAEGLLDDMYPAGFSSPSHFTWPPIEIDDLEEILSDAVLPPQTPRWNTVVSIESNSNEEFSEPENLEDSTMETDLVINTTGESTVKESLQKVTNSMDTREEKPESETLLDRVDEALVAHGFDLRKSNSKKSSKSRRERARRRDRLRSESSTERSNRLQKNRERLLRETPAHREIRLQKQRVRDAKRREKKLAKAKAKAKSKAKSKSKSKSKSHSKTSAPERSKEKVKTKAKPRSPSHSPTVYLHSRAERRDRSSRMLQKKLAAYEQKYHELKAAVIGPRRVTRSMTNF